MKKGFQRKCLVCGNKFYVYPCKRDLKFYCSRTCAFMSPIRNRKIGLANAIALKGKWFPNQFQKGTKIGVGRKKTQEEIEKIRIASTGRNNWQWKGGRRERKGYIAFLNPEHPNCDNMGYVREHRLVIEKHLGRYLKHNEVVHHINKNKKDNRIKNLMLFSSNVYHLNFHRNNFIDNHLIFDGRELNVSKE